MSTELRNRPAPTRKPRADASRTPPPRPARADALLPVLALMTAACLPLARVFIGWSFLRPVLGAVFLAVGLGWGARRLGAGPLLGLGLSVLGWAVFVSAAFLSPTTVLGVLPTPDTFGAAQQLWLRGVELIRSHPAPVPADAALLFLSVTGIWAVAHAVEGLVGRLEAPVKAILLALAVWIVPVMVTADKGAEVSWTVPFLTSAALLLFLFSGTDLRRWGTLVTTSGGRALRATRAALAPSASLIAGVAVLTGVLLAGTLPGFGEPPWYELRGVGGTTLTTNPIVNIRPSLVATDQGAVLRVRTPRAVYLRTTALDVYSEAGEWTNAGIRSTPVGRGDGAVPPDSEIARPVRLDVEIEVVDLPRAVLVPAPYQPQAVTGDIEGALQYDRDLATITTDRDVTLQPDDRYEVTAHVPNPAPDTLAGLNARGPEELTRLPVNVPPQVGELAADIVAEADAATPFEQALAIQEHLRGWEYSLEPPAGHSGDAMAHFIEERVGYCEQYAGTMAVMLRTLDIPARVAVGFTPGELVGEDTYAVSNGNAHAWVEVLFPGQGWLAFEPTPRTDDNVLRPSAENLAPARTLAEEREQQVADGPEEAVEPDPSPEPTPAENDSPDPRDREPAPREEPADEPAGSRWFLRALLGGLVVLGAALAGTHQRRQMNARPPHERVLAARERVGRLGGGLGMPAVDYETDHEYLHRLTAADPSEVPRRAAHTLATRAAEARYAPHLAAGAVDDAEAAAALLREHLLAGRSAARRAAVGARGAWSAVTRRVIALAARRR